MTLPIALVGAVLAAATSLHIPVSTTNAQAQAAIDRGLFLYYAYNREGAHRSFADAAAHDPRLAMAFWGLALTDGPDLNTPMNEQHFSVAKREIAQAASFAVGATGPERRLISIMALRFAGRFGDWPEDDAAYARAMETFAKETDDENARLLAAEALLEHGGLAWSGDSPANAGSRSALALVNGALHDDPVNAMANHLCLHLYDLAPNRNPAKPCAQRLDAAAFSPEAEHLAHMPAHYWIETGDYDAAVRSSDRAYALMGRMESAPDGDAHVQQYLKHNVAVGYAAAMMLESYATARKWAQRMAAADGINFNAITALRFGDFQTAYDATDPQYGNPALKGWAALLLGRAKEANGIAARIEALKATGGYITPLFLARVAEARGDAPGARRWIARASEEQRRDLSGELIPLVPASEQLGDLEVRSGNRAAAQSAFEETLATYPNDPRALSAIKALEAGGASPVTAAGFP